MHLIIDFIMIAILSPATVYGYGEKNCGNPGNAKPCVYGAITSSGEIFNPKKVTAALPVPKDTNFKPFDVYVKNYKNECILLRINDKSNHRWVGKRGLDLTPAAVTAIVGKSHKKWSGKLEFCDQTYSILFGSL